MNYSLILFLNIFQYFKTNNNGWFVWISLVWFSSSNRSLLHIWGRRVGWKKPKWNDRRCVRGKKHREKRERLFLTFCQSFSLSFCTFWNTPRSSRSNSSDVSTSRVLETPKFELIENIANQKSILKYAKSFSNDFIAWYFSIYIYILNGIRDKDDNRKFSSSMLFCRHW